jgi:hypothetical protein
MDISKKSAELMLDLVEIKISMMQVNDKDDAKELNYLRSCREQLLSVLHSSVKESVVKMENYKKL